MEKNPEFNKILHEALHPSDVIGEMTFELNSPITEDQWDMITDVDFEHTNEITFHTKHGKTVRFVKASARPEIIHCKECKWKSGSECTRFADVRPFPDDFCSRGERIKDGSD